MLEFGVHSITYDNEKTIVSGRCYLGPLRIGDQFKFVYEITCPKTEEGYVSSHRGNFFQVDLIIESIRAYGYSFDELAEGMTAEFVLTGQHNNAIQTGFVLGG